MITAGCSSERKGATGLLEEARDLVRVLNTHVPNVVSMQGGCARNLGKGRWQVVPDVFGR